MTWSAAPKTTAHTCGGPVFGRKTPGCPRCDELLAGAAPVVWAGSRVARDNAAYRASVARHDCVARRCGPVCVAFDW